jgi:hypothetical protein
MFLTAEELTELTNRIHRRAQRTVLNFMGIEHKVRPDGSVLVLRSHVEKQMGGGTTPSSKRKHEPNWGAI